MVIYLKGPEGNYHIVYNNKDAVLLEKQGYKRVDMKKELEAKSTAIHETIEGPSENPPRRGRPPKVAA